MPALPLEVRDPREVGPYRLIGRLGEGGQGIVYLATSPGGQQVAVKMLKTDNTDAGTDRAIRRRLAEEVEAAKRVDEFCTAKVLDSSVEGPIPYVVSEYVPGPSLFDRVQTQGPLGGGELTRLMITTASGLTAIHGAEVVHRDLKPSNVLLGPDGARVVDFGIARPASTRTHTGQLIGTPSYFAPEQLRGHSSTSKASDVFAWAGTMVFAATGRAPFGQADYDHELAALFERIKNDEPDLRGVPARLLPLLRICLHKDPAQRPEAWNVLNWLVNPSARVVDSEVAGEQITQNALALLSNTPYDGPQIEMPPPGPPPGPASAPPPAPAPPQAVNEATSPPTEQNTVPPVPTPPPAPPKRRTSRTPLAAALLVLVIIAAVGGWLLFGGSGDEGGVPARFAGTWTGQVSESNGYRNAPTQVSLSLRKGEATGRLAGSRCSGNLQVGESTGDKLTFKITSGPCAAGSLVMTWQKGTLDYYLRGGSSDSGQGTLTKTGS